MNIIYHKFEVAIALHWNRKTPRIQVSIMRPPNEYFSSLLQETSRKLENTEKKATISNSLFIKFIKEVEDKTQKEHSDLPVQKICCYKKNNEQFFLMPKLISITKS